jgi:hypothetical protein
VSLSQLAAQPASALDLIGSQATTLVSVSPHRLHSNVRCSTPSGREATAVESIRIVLG